MSTTNVLPVANDLRSARSAVGLFENVLRLRMLLDSPMPVFLPWRGPSAV